MVQYELNDDAEKLLALHKPILEVSVLVVAGVGLEPVQEILALLQVGLIGKLVEDATDSDDRLGSEVAVFVRPEDLLLVELAIVVLQGFLVVVFLFALQSSQDVAVP